MISRVDRSGFCDRKEVFVGRIALWIGVAACSFVLGFAVAVFWFGHSSIRDIAAMLPPGPVQLFLEPDDDLTTASDLPILAYCEVVNKPDKYDGKIVRVSTIMGSKPDLSFFVDAKCGGAYAIVSFQSDDEKTRIFGKDRSDLPPTDVIVVGRFYKVTPKNESDSIWDSVPLHFDIITIEAVAPLFG